MAAPKVGLDRSKTGRQKGTPNKTTTVLKEAILLAGEEVGNELSDGEGLKGYLKHVARSDIKSFTGLVGKVLPLQVTGEGGGALILKWED